MKDTTKLGLLSTCAFICACGIGWFVHDGYNILMDHRQVQGLWFSNINYTQMSKQAKEIDNNGEWVCVNVVKSMSYKDIVNTCEHEAAHELFARQCTANVEKCMEVIEK